MAGNTRNIIQGGAKVYLGPQGTAFPSLDTNPDSANTQVGSFVDVGHTSEGLDITVEPDYLDVEVDLLLDSAALFKTSQRVTIATSFTEATLENFAFVIGQPDTSVETYDKLAAVDAAAPMTTAGDYKELTIDGGALGDEPEERAFLAVGPAPRQDTSGAHTDAQERLYYAPRVISTESVATGVKRNEVTMFPVTFRCLPDSENQPAGQEYGRIVDRLYGTSVA